MVFIRVLFFFVFVYTVKSQYVVPSVTLEALKKGGFRVYIPDVEGTSLFAFHANINDNIRPQHPGSIIAETKTPQDGFWILEFPNQLKIGDVINYWIFVNANHLGYRKDGQPLRVLRLLDSYTKLRTRCEASSTTINGGKSTCVGSSILSDPFDGPFVDTSLWTVEHRIPTYVGPDFYFNSFENRAETRFFVDQKLHLKPMALSEAEVRGTLNLRLGCTSTDNLECFYESKSSFLLPPVRSAKIVSKTTFKYGKVDIRAKLPQGDWIVPIIQLEPKQKNTVNPTTIWIAYSRGNSILTDNDPTNIEIRGTSGNDIGSRLLLAGPIVDATEPGRSRRLVSKYENRPFYDDFHNYGLEWTQDKLQFFFDGTQYGSVDLSSLPNVFNQELILGIGVAVGGINDFPDDTNSGNFAKPWTNGDRNNIKRFFQGKSTWASTWDSDRSVLVIDSVKVTAI